MKYKIVNNTDDETITIVNEETDKVIIKFTSQLITDLKNIHGLDLMTEIRHIVKDSFSEAEQAGINAAFEFWLAEQNNDNTN